MAPRIRYYQKKRGNRRTGSKTMARVGEAIFFAVLLLLGCGGLVVMFFSQVVPQWRVNHEFLRHGCVVLDTRVDERETEGGAEYRPEVQIEYRIEDETYRIWTYDIWTLEEGGYRGDGDQARAALDRYPVGREIDCWYNPVDPSEAVVVRRASWWVWLVFLVPAAFVLVGGGGLIYTLVTWGKSAERRAATAAGVAHAKAPGANGRGRAEFPYVPLPVGVTDSPGTKLAFRLPAAAGSTWAVLMTLGAAVLWNGIVAALAVVAVGGHLRGEPDWLLTIFLVPFAVGGVALVVWFVRQFLAAAGIGPTLLEISEQPLVPGRRYRVFLSQAGKLKLRSLEMVLACDEEATYRHGTNARTESHRVFQQAVLCRKEFEVGRGEPFEADCELDVPAGAMHSFKADHNEISWRLVVRGTPDGWPPYERSFPVIVCPAADGGPAP